MNIFSVNQVNQVYVVGDLKTTAAGVTSEGDLFMGTTPDGKSIYFVHKGKGGITRSDLIDIDKIMYVKGTPASATSYKLKTATITLNSDYLDSSNLVAGQDYILRIAFNNYIGISPEDSQYWKYGVVHATNGMGTSDFYKKMALSIVKNMSREAVELIGVKLVKSDNSTADVTKASTETSLNGTYKAITLVEKEQDWVLGMKQQKRLSFEAVATSIDIVEGMNIVSVQWGDTVYADSDTAVPNGKLAADYEHFFHGERGDQYRKMGFPEYIPTEYMVDPTKEYDFVGIHFSYIGSNESVQKSEKDITFLAPRTADDSTASAVGALGQSIVAAINAVLPMTNDQVADLIDDKIDEAAAEGGEP